MINSIKNLEKIYKIKEKEISNRLIDFSKVSAKDYQKELIFCLLTPQSQAKKCWQAVEELDKNKITESSLIQQCLKTKTRFHNNKTKYILNLRKNWKNIQNIISSEPDIVKLRNYLADNVLGLGLKEASHFLRNIGKSNNQVAILDRHILRNLKNLKIIDNIKLNKKLYLEIENKMKEFSESINIPLDYLDLVFWSEENGSIFK